MAYVVGLRRTLAARPPFRRRILCAVLALLVAFAPAIAEARAGGGGGSSRSSGGYSRPSARTPSVSVPRAAPRAPSTSGGYSRPGASAPSSAPRRPSVAAPSASDQAISRRNADETLRRYQAQEAQRRAPAPSAPAPAPSSPGRAAPPPPSRGDWGWSQPAPRGGWSQPGRGGWYGGRGWTAPPWASGQRSFGVWDGVFLWFLLDTLTRPGHADWFHNNRDDPGYRQWRQEAERRAADDTQLRQRLDRLDAELADRQGKPRDPGYLPPDTPPEIALAADGATRTPSAGDVVPAEESGGGFLIALLVVAGGAVFLFVMARRRRAARPASGGSMDPLSTAANIVRQKISGERSEGTKFRIGMTLTLDPTPFLLAQGTTKVPVPTATGGNILVSVAAVGRVDAGGVPLTRLYLDDRSYFQLHLDADGTPDECRFFGRIDEVTPGDAAEWAFWLDEREGMIGWPEFQTKDGKIYARAWSPGAGRVAPNALAETVSTQAGEQTLQHQAMLYAAPTGAAAPAPPTEYILVSAVEAGGRAWVAVEAGIDVNPAALSLA